MSRIIYYLGAGASYGKREKEYEGTSAEATVIKEGLPVVAEIPSRIQRFREFIASADIDPRQQYNFQDLYWTSGSDIITQKDDMLEDIDDLYDGILEHATIDTYAKKLHLTNDIRRFKTLKRVLCAFFIWEQFDHAPDQRYDTFLANVLSEGRLCLPENISVISWNYDSQFELAYRFYSRKTHLPIFDKNSGKEDYAVPACGCIFKVNGSATFFDGSAVNRIISDDKIPQAIQLILFYGDTKVDTSQLGFEFEAHLSFAWEATLNQERMMQSIKSKTADTETVVVIGYSFPFFNREIDRSIFANMPNLKKVYIQDINAQAIVPSLMAVLAENTKVVIEKIVDCSQFYLPREL